MAPPPVAMSGMVAFGGALVWSKALEVLVAGVVLPRLLKVSSVTAGAVGAA